MSRQADVLVFHNSGAYFLRFHPQGKLAGLGSLLEVDQGFLFRDSSSDTNPFMQWGAIGSREDFRSFRRLLKGTRLRVEFAQGERVPMTNSPTDLVRLAHPKDWMQPGQMYLWLLDQIVAELRKVEVAS